MANAKDYSEEPFSDDPQKNLQIENELLRLKLQAEFGAVSAGSADMPAEMEHEFLKSGLAFEQRSANAKRVTLYELLGRPVYKKADDLDEQFIGEAFQAITGMLDQHNIDVAFLRPRDDRFKYRFITEELFEHEMDDLLMPDMMICFTYEEFHPDHDLDIRSRVDNLLSGWFNRSTKEIGIYLADNFMIPQDNILPKAQLLEKLDLVFAAYTAFEEQDFSISNVAFEIKEGDERVEAVGHAEGELRYVAVLENGERKKIEGPFKIYLNCEYNWWQIYFFYLPGLNG